MRGLPASQGEWVLPGLTTGEISIRYSQRLTENSLGFMQNTFVGGRRYWLHKKGDDGSGALSSTV